MAERQRVGSSPTRLDRGEIHGLRLIPVIDLPGTRGPVCVRVHIRLLQAKVLLQRDRNRLFESTWVLSKQLGLDWSIDQSLHEGDDLCRVVHWISHDTAH